jgi:UDP-glucose 4-epimerase
MKSTVLVTGGLGYLGGRICKHLSQDVKLKIRLTTRKNIYEVQDWMKDIEVVQSDILKDDLDVICRNAKSIVHLASVNEIISASDPELALAVNGLGTLRLLRAAIKNGVSRFIYFSTAHVYGAPLKGNITENTLPRPMHPYAISHKAAEDFVLAAHDQGKLLGIVIRMTNGYGAPASLDSDRWSLLVNDLCRQAVADRKLVLKSSGVQKRNFISLPDICRAVSHFLDLEKERCGNGLFNVGSEETRSILEIAGIVRDRCSALFGYAPELTRNLKDEDSSDFVISIDKLKETGFQIHGEITRDIDETLLFCKKNFG